MDLGGFQADAPLDLNLELKYFPVLLNAEGSWYLPGPGFLETVPTLNGSFAETLYLKVNYTYDFVVPKS